jgi:hypothetical protein
MCSGLSVEGHTTRGGWAGLELSINTYRDGVIWARGPDECHFRDCLSVTSKTTMGVTHSILHRYPLRMVPRQNRYYHCLRPGSNQPGHFVVAHMQTKGKQH